MVIHVCGFLNKCNTNINIIKDMEKIITRTKTCFKKKPDTRMHERSVYQRYTHTHTYTQTHTQSTCTLSHSHPEGPWMWRHGKVPLTVRPHLGNTWWLLWKLHVRPKVGFSLTLKFPPYLRWRRLKNSSALGMETMRWSFCCQHLKWIWNKNLLFNWITESHRQLRANVQC